MDSTAIMILQFSIIPIIPGHSIYCVRYKESKDVTEITLLVDSPMTAVHVDSTPIML